MFPPQAGLDPLWRKYGGSLKSDCRKESFVTEASASKEEAPLRTLDLSRVERPAKELSRLTFDLGKSLLSILTSVQY